MRGEVHRGGLGNLIEKIRGATYVDAAGGIIQMHQFTEVDFIRFKAFKRFTLRLRRFNILVGPNNAGKSTILAAFRILAASLRKAESRTATYLRVRGGNVLGYQVDLSSISVAEENLFYDYDDTEPASVVFTLSNKNKLTLYFPEPGVCYLLPDAQGKAYGSPSTFRKQFDCPIGFVPILGPVDHHEIRYEKEAARLALYSYGAARNFRNIWYHYPENFEHFRSLLQQTWPGMDIEPPEVDLTHGKPRLHMYCPEDRKPRELFWAGFGFQVWCQMLTHIIQSKNVSLFLIDEPDIYLHAELQRQLLEILKNLGPDILLATHSTEMITESEPNDIVLINKAKDNAKRLKNPSELLQVFSVVGSSLNPILTQLAKTRRVVFVEGKDFQLLGRFARKLGAQSVANRRDFAVVPVEGFNPERIKNLKRGMEETLGGSIKAAAILDRDYRSDDECEQIRKNCEMFCNLAVVHPFKEIESYVLISKAIVRAISKRVEEKSKRNGAVFSDLDINLDEMLNTFCSERKNYVSAQYLDFRRRFERQRKPGTHSATVDELGLGEFEERWKDPLSRIFMVPAKDALDYINGLASEKFGVSITPASVVDAMKVEEVPMPMKQLISQLTDFSKIAI